MNNLSIIGKVVHAFRIKSGQGEKGYWESQEYLVSYKSGNYDKKILLSAMGNVIQQIHEGKEYEFFLNIDANEYKDKWYNRINVWKVKATQPAIQVTPIDPLTDGMPF